VLGWLPYGWYNHGGCCWKFLSPLSQIFQTLFRGSYVDLYDEQITTKLTKFRARLKSGQNAMLFRKKQKVKNDDSLFTFLSKIKKINGCVCPVAQQILLQSPFSQKVLLD
jgi:hypothetical protein